MYVFLNDENKFNNLVIEKIKKNNIQYFFLQDKVNFSSKKWLQELYSFYNQISKENPLEEIYFISFNELGSEKMLKEIINANSFYKVKTHLFFNSSLNINSILNNNSTLKHVFIYMLSILPPPDSQTLNKEGFKSFMDILNLSINTIIESKEENYNNRYFKDLIYINDFMLTEMLKNSKIEEEFKVIGNFKTYLDFDSQNILDSIIF